MLLGGCGPSEAELRQQRLEEAVATTLAGPVAFNLSVDASDEALGAFGDAAGPLAALLAGSSAAGVIEGDRIAVGLALGGVDVVQARVTAPGEQYVRFNLGALAEFATGEAAAVDRRLEEALATAALEPDARAAVLAAARGEWVRLEAAAIDGPSASASVGEALEALLLAAVPVGHAGDLGEEPFDGRIDVEIDVARALAAGAQALAGIAPGALPSDDPANGPTSATTAPGEAEMLRGRVLVEAGVVRAVVLELGPLVDGAGAGTAPIELELDLRRLDAAELVRAPEVAATVTLEQLERAAAVLGELDPATEP